MPASRALVGQLPVSVGPSRASPGWPGLPQCSRAGRALVSRYESVIATLCENLDSLDEPEARAAMIWIVGEYAERIDNADELLESFLEGFHDESTQVRCWVADLGMASSSAPAVPPALKPSSQPGGLRALPLLKLH